MGAKHSLCLISMLSKMHPSESMPMKNSFVGLKSRKACVGSLITMSKTKVGGQMAEQSNRICHEKQKERARGEKMGAAWHYHRWHAGRSAAFRPHQHSETAGQSFRRCGSDIEAA